jgi:hypothetical protein
VEDLVDNAPRCNEPGGWVSVETGAACGHLALRAMTFFSAANSAVIRNYVAVHPTNP